ncbi:MAG TPA: GNAT family N-acetyltransferase [Candidatus Merdivicinus excrementipullorum]|uniref:GNAT family N-acetyltransferase n=1 Tax=Candidatus Merdivicinus excrementipullorum TaxID=2840867 RepID=A0A9D1FL17_9FIRM|nr:GNAT family N-acetyltransferase [Candidatus Merdivicinus excrementipullorum]
MLDFSLPYYGVLMLREHPEETLPAALPQGFSFCGWKPGMETEWAKLMARTEMMESFEKGLSYFREEFLSHPEELPANMLFVRSLEGEIIGTASLWKGACFGEPRYRIHWVAVDGRYEGRGIGKAMLARLCAQWDGLHCPKPLYLATQTWSWQAISLYARFGFRPYLGPQPVNWKTKRPDVPFAEENRAAWELIAGKLEHRNFRQYLTALSKEEST